MKINEIVAAFNLSLQNFPDLTAKYGLLDWKNFSGEPEATDAYITCFLLNPDFQSLAVDGSDSCDVMRGIFQINISVPAGIGVFAAATLAQSLREYYPRDIPINSGTTKIMIERVVFNSSGITDGAHKTYPVSVYFNSLS